MTLLFSESEKKNDLPEKYFAADPSASERLDLSLTQTLTVKLANHEIVLWCFVLVHS